VRADSKVQRKVEHWVAMRVERSVVLMAAQKVVPKVVHSVPLSVAWTDLRMAEH
jgi:hypothetical protein